HRVLGELDAAEGLLIAKDHYDKALSVARSISRRDALIEALLARGRWTAKRGEVPSAANDLEEALGYAVSSGYRIYEADIRVALAWMHKAAGQLQTARKEAEKAHRMSEEMGYYWGQKDADEVLAIVLLGAALGTGLGLWLGSGLTQYYTNFFHFPLLRYEAGRGLILSAIAISAGAATFGAFTALRQAVSLPPAEAMRPEPPAQFRPTLVERLGLQRWFSPASRIILRNLERRPLQAFFSITGIAFAVAILVIGRYFIDVTDLLVDVQFRTIQREDITLAFNEALPGRARYDLAHLPGVMQVEPFRAIPARLRHDHYTHRSGLTGLEPNSNLRRLLDRDLNEVPLPPDGVVMSKKLAEMLHVAIGDPLTVEVLEGERPTRTIPVVGTVDDLIGVAAYTDIRALNRLMREGPSLSGAYLKVDMSQSDRLYAQLKRTPAVASIALRQTGIARFQETVAQSLRVFTIVLVIFACIIAFGVAYNTARIALSERSRELATLRIIGFTKEEVAFILLGEQAVLTLTAIPFGFGLGIGGSALMSLAYNTELYRLPVTIGRSTYGFAVIVIALAAIASGWFVRRQLDRVDLVAVLKTRE
ncbi:MAG: FtsX-like permease family protein, partial [Cyanobacteria bacterium J06639_1]